MYLYKIHAGFIYYLKLKVIDIDGWHGIYETKQENFFNDIKHFFSTTIEVQLGCVSNSVRILSFNLSI